MNFFKKTIQKIKKLALFSAWRTAIFLTISIIATTLFFSSAFDHDLTRVYYEVATKKVTTPIRAVLLADMHNSLWGKNQQIIINHIEEVKPDLILLAGDMTDFFSDDKNLFNLLQQIGKKYPCYFVTGNHDDSNIKRKIYTDNGIIDVNQACEEITIRGQKIQICGIDYYCNIEYSQEKIAAQINNQSYTIFLAHNPEFINTYRELDTDLILSGHLHGGQIRFPFLCNGLYAHIQGLFPEIVGGRYDFINHTFIISRGMTNDHPKIIPRIFNPPEFVIIDIVPKK